MCVLDFDSARIVHQRVRPHRPERCGLAVHQRIRTAFYFLPLEPLLFSTRARNCPVYDFGSLAMASGGPMPTT